MEFAFTEEQNLLRDSVREFASREIRPHIMEWDESQTMPVDIFKKMGELGFLGIVAPEAHEGAGLTSVDFCIVMEELAAVDPSIALSFAAHSGLCLQHILAFANEEQLSAYVPALATGRVLGAWCLTEPGSGSDASGMLTNAKRNGDTYLLNGSKIFITNGGSASTYVVTAKTDPDAGNRGISAFIVEKAFGGISVGKKENKLGMRASETVQLSFDNVKVPARNLLGKEGEGFRQALAVLDSGRIGIAALSTGLAQGALNAAVAYAKERQQFGRPIADFQGIQFSLADMATEVQASRLLTYRAAAARSRGEDVTQIAAQAKYFASETAQRASTAAVQIHGGYGYMKDYPVEKFYRDAKLLTIGEGTSEVQRMVIARSVLS